MPSDDTRPGTTPGPDTRPDANAGIGAKAGDLVKRAAQGWLRDGSPMIAAALSYYAVVALAPLLVVAVAVTGLLLERELSREFLVAQVRALAGPQPAEVVDTIVRGTRDTSGQGWATAIALGAAVLGAAGGFAQLQSALDKVWNVPKRRRGLLGALLARLPSFAMLAVVGLLLLVSAAASAVFGSLDFPLRHGTLPPVLLETVNLVLSIAVLTPAFAAVYKVLPDTDVRWRDVLAGALVTAVLFTVGKTVLGVYLGSSAVASAYGAAGSLALLLIWLYYSAQVVLFGAEFTQVWACTYGSRRYSRLCRPGEERADETRGAGSTDRPIGGGAHVG